MHVCTDVQHCMIRSREPRHILRDGVYNLWALIISRLLHDIAIATAQPLAELTLGSSGCRGFVTN